MTTQERYDIIYGKKKIDASSIVGNTARVAEPERVERPKKVQKERRVVQPSAEQYEAWKNTRLYLAVAAIAILCICHIFLSSANYSQRRENAALKMEISTVLTENQELKAGITEAANLAKIKKIATKRYGMVTPNKSHIIKYGSEKKDYVRQYSSIPE